MGNIQSIEDQKYLLGDMLLAENRGRTSIFDQLEHLKHVLIDMPTTWSIIDIPLKKRVFYTMGIKIWQMVTRNQKSWKSQ